MPLSDTACRNAKPEADERKLTDDRGLYLLVKPNGTRAWRWNYRFAGKQGTMAYGTYPDVPLAEARKRHAKARELHAAGIDPSAAKQADKRAKREAGADTFAAIAAEWLGKQKLAKVTRGKHQWMFDDLLLPWLGHRPISEIDSPELLAVLRRTESRGKLESSQRAKQLAGRVFRYAIATGRARHNPADALRGALATPKTRHHASITEPARIAELLRAINGYSGSFVTASALRLAALVFARPNELRRAEWSEIDLDGAEWRIPAAKMKMGQTHIVPLSTQAVAILREIQPLTGPDGYVFPGVRGRSRPMSENTINAALRRLGYTNTDMTGHGFRSMASTLLNEQGWKPDAIERQLAHAERNKVRGAYNYAEHLPERRKMMQAWADYLDRLRVGGNVIVGNFGQAV